MTFGQLRSMLDSLKVAEPILKSLGLADTERGHQNLVRIAELGIPLDLVRTIVVQLTESLPRSVDPDRALNNLERYLAACTSPLAAAALFERDPAAIGVLARLFSTSQYFSDLIITAPPLFEWLRGNWRGTRRAESWRDELASELRALPDTELRLNALRRFRQAELLRIGYRDIIGDVPLETITGEISDLADACVAVALELASKRMIDKHGPPECADGRMSQFVVLAMGKLGGQELNYSSDIDLIFIYDGDGMTTGSRSVSHEEFWGRVGGELARILTQHTERGVAYRVDLRLRPEGDRGPIVRSLASTLAYYDTMGRTWERQALIKVRPIAGLIAREDTRLEAVVGSALVTASGISTHLTLGRDFLEQICPFVYRRFITYAEINEIKALKRRIEARAKRAGEALQDVKTGHGGIRDVEFVVQFLQLLNAGGLPELRQANTLKALNALERTGCLTPQERILLEQNYRFFRKVEHRLQTMFDLQTHTLPQDREELERLARRVGYDPAGPRHATSARARFESDLRGRAQLNRRMLDHLLHESFLNEEADSAEPETDLVLTPEPDETAIKQVLGRYQFRDVAMAYRSLIELAREPVPFLSTPRCRHFLASIAPRLLRELAMTPDPDMALLNIERVTASLGARGALWELFSFNPPTLKLCVELCAWSQFLSQILINNPGMIDDLMDSLVLNQPRPLSDLRLELEELCRGAEDLLPILHSFKDKEVLRVGVRDILGKDTPGDTTLALSDIAQVVLEAIVRDECGELVDRLGEPTIEEGPRAGQASRLVVLALGKFGGQELSYHSDLDIIFMYEADGMTRIQGRRRGWEPTSNLHFYSELGTRIIRVAGTVGPQGRLYMIDPRLRPTGRSGSLVISIDQFHKYYLGGSSLDSEGQGDARPGAAARTAALWERQMMTKARVVYGEPEIAARVKAEAEAAAYAVTWKPTIADELFSVRMRLEESRSEADLKRGFGGIVDIEFLVQMLQLKYGPTNPAVRHPNTRIAMERLRTAWFLDGYTHSFLVENYEYLRRVESRLRIVHNIARDALPDAPADVEKLARRLGYQASNGRSASDAFISECERITRQTRQTFIRLLSQETGRV